MNTVFVGDEGTELILDCGVNISTATVRKVMARRPGGSKVEWVATASGTNAIKYVVQTGDLNVAGPWELQAYIEMPGWKGRGEWSTLKVLP